MNTNKNKRMAVLSSFLAFSIDVLLDDSFKTKGSVINARQVMVAKALKLGANDGELKDMTDNIWISIIDKYKDRNYKLYVSEFIESLIMSNYELFIEYYGHNQVYRFLTMTQKIMELGVSKEIIANTRDIVDDINKELDKAFGGC